MCHAHLVRLRALLLGLFLLFWSLLLIAYLLSALFVLSQFSGTAILPADCAIVFGSAVHGAGEPGPGILRRTDAAFELFRTGSVHMLIFAGGRGEGSAVSEAQVMQSEARKAGVPLEKMRLEEHSSSTWENIKFVRPLLDGCTSVIAVSDRYHLSRIRLTAWRQGITLGTYSASAPENPLFEFREIAREAMANLFYLARR